MMIDFQQNSFNVILLHHSLLPPKEIPLKLYKLFVFSPLYMPHFPSNPKTYDSITFRGELSYLAPLGSENISAPYFKQCFFRSNTTPPSPKTETTNILFYILNLWLRIYCFGLRGCDTREKEIVIWPCWCFHGRYYFYSLKFTLMFINERKRDANTYLISNFDRLEAAPSNLPP